MVDVGEIGRQIIRMVEDEITPENMVKLLVNRNGRLYARFPSRKVREWALERQREYGLGQSEKDIDILLYECARLVYKNLEFDLGRNYNIGWAYTTCEGIRMAVEKIVERKTGVDVLDMDYDARMEIEKISGAVISHCFAVAGALNKVLMGGVSLGALRWRKSLLMDTG